MNTGLVLYEQESRQIGAICDRLTREANARVVFLVDKNGQLIATSGQDPQLDTTSLASLTAGNVAAMGGLAKLIGEKEFPTQYHEGERESLHMSVVGGRVVLVVLFDARSSLGLVRLRVKKAGDELAKVFDALAAKQAAPGAPSPFAEITDDDIDNLFADDVASR
jgi:predicted regulator of Ras-like GTPase activity (Roadblock/LC7/MglB family)